MFIFVQVENNLQWRHVIPRRLPSPYANRITENPASKKSQLIGPMVDVEF
jgi:hypothetical protein